MATYEQRAALDQCHYNALVRDTMVDGEEDLAEIAVRHIQTRTKTACVFFSKRNIEVLQTELMSRIRRITGMQISRQADSELFVVMRSTYLQHARNDPEEWLEDVRDLNLRVLVFCVPKILGAMTQYLRYKDEIGRAPMPLDHPTYMSTAGLRGENRGIERPVSDVGAARGFRQ